MNPFLQHLGRSLPLAFFAALLIASEVSIFAYSKQLHERMAAHQRAANSA